MRCFVSHKKVRHKKSLAEQDAAATAAAASSAKMMRTLSAPPSFTTLVANGSNGNHPTLSSVLSSASPLNPNTPARIIRNNIAVLKKQELLQQQQQDGSSSPLIPHSAGSIPNGYNSLSGLKRDSVFRGQPLPLPTPESCGLPVEARAPTKFMASPRNGAPPPASSNTLLASVHPPENRPVFRRNSSMPLPRPPVERFASAHITFLPDTCCIGESGNGPAFTCTVSIDGVSSIGVQECVQAVLVRLSDTTMQDSKAWIQLVKEIACLSGAHLSRILGFSFSTDEKLVVYEMQANGSLDRLLYGRSREKPPLDWFSRVRIAADAALGLAFLHEKSPNELMYKDFRTFNIHVDRSMRARLMGYGFTQKVLNPKCPMVAAYAAPEMLISSGAAAATTSSSSSSSSSSSLTSNVWSFGVVLLEILTGRQNRDEMFPVEEQDLVIWTTPFLSDERKAFLVVDPELKGMFPARSVAAVAKVALQCLQRDPASRPSMKQVASALESSLEQDFKPGVAPGAASSCGSDSRKPLIEALRVEQSSPSSSSPASSSSTLAVIQGSLQKKLVTKLLCSTAAASE